MEEKSETNGTKTGDKIGNGRTTGKKIGEKSEKT